MPKNTTDPVTRSEKLAYLYAEWVCYRQIPSMRRATVAVWAEANGHAISMDELDYVWNHWRDYVVSVPV